jgi:hypothetical protein
MKKQLHYYILGILILSMALLIYGCGSGATGGGSSGSGGTVTLTGKVTGSGYFISTFTNTIKKVVVFNCGAGYWSASVEAGVFTIEAAAGSPVGIIFAGSNSITSENGFIGYMTLGRGINSLPLNLVNSTVIDLRTIECVSGVATSENDIIDDAITANTISTFDATAMAFGNEMFSGIIKNPDADRNGQVDVLETTSRYYRPFFHYTVTGGNFSAVSGYISTGEAGTGANITNNNFCLDVSDSGGVMPSIITIYYPGGTSYTAEAINGSAPSSTRVLYSIGGGSIGAGGAPSDGTYEVIYGSKTLTFEVAGQTATQEIALIVPTITFDGSNNIEKINWAYKVNGGSGAELTNPASIVDVVQIIIWDKTTPTAVNIYETGFSLSPTPKEHVLSKQIPWGNVGYINMIYKDFYGNNVISSWHI